MQLDFDEPVEGQFVRLMVYSNINGDLSKPEDFNQPWGTTWLRAKYVTHEDGEDPGTPGEPPTDPTDPQVELPLTIPSITGEWERTAGNFTLEPGVSIVVEGAGLETAAGFLASEVGNYLGQGVAPATGGPSGPGDIVLTLDTGEEELGREGYRLEISDRATITASDPVGVLYGTRTLAQMFGQTLTLPQGSATDIPVYGERGVTLSTAFIIHSPEWIDRLLEEMSYFKLNYLLWEMKLPSETYPETATWGYYTHQHTAEVLEKAKSLGITVIPEINSPGHMSNWLLNVPELQLTGIDGTKDPGRLDVTKPEAFEFYTNLIDEYLQIFDGPYWHMGADEYMLGSAFANFPQIGEYATQKFGPGATREDAFFDFINRVNDYVKTVHGKQLRIWNDGLNQRNNLVTLDEDIIVEHWYAGPGGVYQRVDDLLTTNEVMNSPVFLYDTRGGNRVDTRARYNDRWQVHNFDWWQVQEENLDRITGAKISLWQDNAPADTENQVEEYIRIPLRYLAEMTWVDDYVQESYDDFEALVNTIGRPLGWENINRLPVAQGAYSLNVNGRYITQDETGALVATDTPQDAWQLQSTSDYYYRIQKVGTNECLEIVEGHREVQAPIEMGVQVSTVDCGSSNLQKWQFIETEGGYDVVNAITQARLSIDSAGRIVQHEPNSPHSEGDVWNLVEAPYASVSADLDRVMPGGEREVTATITNPGSAALTGATVLLQLPEGWEVKGGGSDVISIGDVAPGTTETSVINIGPGPAAECWALAEWRSVSPSSGTVVSNKPRWKADSTSLWDTRTAPSCPWPMKLAVSTVMGVPPTTGTET